MEHKYSHLLILRKSLEVLSDIFDLHKVNSHLVTLKSFVMRDIKEYHLQYYRHPIF